MLMDAHPCHIEDLSSKHGHLLNLLARLSLFDRGDRADPTYNIDWVVLCLQHTILMMLHILLQGTFHGLQEYKHFCAEQDAKLAGEAH